MDTPRGRVRPQHEAEAEAEPTKPEPGQISDSMYSWYRPGEPVAGEGGDTGGASRARGSLLIGELTPRAFALWKAEGRGPYDVCFLVLQFMCIKHPRERWMVKHSIVAVGRVRAGLCQVISGRRAGEEEARAEPWDPLGVRKGRGPTRGGRERPVMLVGTRGHGSFQERQLLGAGEDEDGGATCGPGTTKAI